MAWTAPASWSVGEVASATKLNAQLRDNMKEVWRLVSHIELPASGGGSTVNVTGAYTPVTVATFPTFTADGVSPIWVEWYVPLANGYTGSEFWMELWESGSAIGAWPDKATYGVAGPYTDKSHIFVPSAASHSYLLRAKTTYAASTASLLMPDANNWQPIWGRIWSKGGA